MEVIYYPNSGPSEKKELIDVINNHYNSLSSIEEKNQFNKQLISEANRLNSLNSKNKIKKSIFFDLYTNIKKHLK